MIAHENSLLHIARTNFQYFRATNSSTYLPSSLPPTSLQTPPPHVTSSLVTSSRQGARGMNTADSFDGSQISDLCHSLSQLTKGTESRFVLVSCLKYLYLCFEIRPVDHFSPICPNFYNIPRLQSHPRISSSHARRARTPTSSIASPAGGFASISVSAHPIDPDCCTRVSRHVLGAYG